MDTDSLGGPLFMILGSKKAGQRPCWPATVCYEFYLSALRCKNNAETQLNFTYS